MAGIVIQCLSKVYGDSTKAIDGLNLEVRPGELLVLVGPSGSGKTTLLRLIAGLDRPTAGTIRLGDRDLASLAPRERDVALVFQSLALYEHWTVRQNLAFAARKQPDKGEQQVAEVADLLGIGHLLDRRPAELSGGEQQRVALGRAIVRQPQALLLDEPLSSLDLPLRRELRREIQGVQRRLGVPTIYVTHDQAEALAVGDRVAVLDRGRIAQVGTPHEIYHQPVSRFVAECFGPQGMNFVKGEWTDEGLSVEWPDGTHHSVLALPANAWTCTDALVDGPVLLGIRPEDIEVLPPNSNKRATTRGHVESTETFGESTYLHVQLNGITSSSTQSLQVTIRVGDDNIPVEPNQTIDLYFRPNRIHWFACEGFRLNNGPLTTDPTEE